MNLAELKEGDEAFITNIEVDASSKKMLLTYGISTGSILRINYSPSYMGMTNLTIKGKMVCLRDSVARAIEVLKL